MSDKALVSRLRLACPRLLLALALASANSMLLPALAAPSPAAVDPALGRSAGARGQSPREQRQAWRYGHTQAGRSSPHAHRGRRHHARHGRRRHGRIDFGATPGLLYRAGVGVSIAPRIEHWGSDYLPDAYRLYDYDGRNRGPRFCRGRSGTTIATTGGDCPTGQHAERRGRALSTRPR